MSPARILDFVIKRPRSVFIAVAVLTVALGLQILRIQVDTDPENMLPASEPARVFHNASKKKFALHDAIVVGVVNDADADGVFNQKTLARLHTLPRQIQGIDGVIARDLISPSTVDSIRPEGTGTIRFE